jgi:hypothetical protein
MIHHRHSPPDLLVLGLAARALSQVQLDLLRFRLRELAIAISCQVPRNVLPKHR